MGDFTIISVKIPKELYNELAIRIPEGERSRFIREAIIEKLKKTPKPDKIIEIEERLKKIEAEISEIKHHLSNLEILTFETGKINPYSFCTDEIDRKLIEHLLHYKGATTPELSEATGLNRWLILNRLKRIERISKQKIGRPIITYYAGKRMGKKKAWWITEDLIEEE